jgi:beta-galactosidase
VVRIEIADKEGRLVPVADNLIQLKVTGEGAIIGVGNGDPNCHEPDKSDRRSLFNGLAQALVQATGKPGFIRIEAGSEGIASATLVIAARERGNV